VDVADPRDARGCLSSISSRKASTEPKPLCPVSGEGGGVLTDMSPSPRPRLVRSALPIIRRYKRDKILLLRSTLQRAGRSYGGV
jgi:hypothetical protein